MELALYPLGECLAYPPSRVNVFGLRHDGEEEGEKSALFQKE
jgi:hypothetical protein